MKEHIRYLSDDVIEIESNETWLEYILIDKMLGSIVIGIAWIIVISMLLVSFIQDFIKSQKKRHYK